tara:strand:+ start:1027 stop:1251 length:225 start_codon:yes stop_codon:yes gene_type:complete
MKHANKGKVDNSIADWPFTYVNYLLFLIGILLITIGYILMYTGDVNSFQSLTLSPIILVIGYCVIIPISIFYRK